MATDLRSAAVRWAVFVGERFPLPVHLPLVLAFGGGNQVVAVHGNSQQSSAGHTALILGVTLLFFFRLRLFDELKDRDTDRSEHPERPIPRGLIRATEVQRVAALCFVTEGALAVVTGWTGAVAWSLAAVYSLLMYREFFCGDWLRPKMELYALTHTLVAGGLGGFIACAATMTAPWDLPRDVLVFAVANWCVFNVFEFARKTYGHDESDGRAQNYSQRLGPVGAVLLSLGWTALAVVLSETFVLSGLSPRWIWPARLILLGPPLLASIVYLASPYRSAARIYRAVFAAFLLAYYAVLIAGFWWGGATP